MPKPKHKLSTREQVLHNLTVKEASIASLKRRLQKIRDEEFKLVRKINDLEEDCAGHRFQLRTDTFAEPPRQQQTAPTSK